MIFKTKPVSVNFSTNLCTVQILKMWRIKLVEDNSSLLLAILPAYIQPVMAKSGILHKTHIS